LHSIAPPQQTVSPIQIITHLSYLFHVIRRCPLPVTMQPIKIIYCLTADVKFLIIRDKTN